MKSRWHTSNSRRATLAAVVVAALAGAIVATSIAPAHNVSFGNQVNLNRARDYLASNYADYKGQVSSSKPNCKRNREVQIWRVDTPSDVRLKTTHTTPTGFFRVKGPQVAAGEKVYALIETKVIPSGAGHNHTCRVDRSPVRTYPYP